MREQLVRCKYQEIQTHLSPLPFPIHGEKTPALSR
jgi:hypothetical protein